MTTPFSRIPQPMFGMNWEPSPSDYTAVPPPTKYGDTDFANDDFVALWNVDGNGVGRYDLKTIAKMGCNTIKMYNWSAPAPHHWRRNHVKFLAMAAQLGLGVIVPISNYFTAIAYCNRTGSGSGPGPNQNLQTFITAIVTEVYQNKKPGAAIMWAIGNEYDLAAPGSYDYCEAQDIATIASYIVAAETSLGISSGDVLAFTSPVSTALPPLPNPGIPHTNPTYSKLMGGYAIAALIDAFNAKLGSGVTKQRFLASINSYQMGHQLIDFNNAFPKAFPGVRYFYGELGWSELNGSQSIYIHNQFSTVRKLATVGQPFYGACCFEYSDELWKTSPPGGTDARFGLTTFGGSSKSSTEGAHSPVWGAQYPVDELTHRNAFGAFEKAIKGQ